MTEKVLIFVGIYVCGKIFPVEWYTRKLSWVIKILITVQEFTKKAIVTCEYICM